MTVWTTRALGRRSRVAAVGRARDGGALAVAVARQASRRGPPSRSVGQAGVGFRLVQACPAGPPRSLRPDAGHGCGDVSCRMTRPLTVRAMVTATGDGVHTRSAAWGWALHPARSAPTAGDLHISTVDTQGRLWLRQPALRLGWMPDMRLVGTVHNSVLRLQESDRRPVAVDVGLDRRYRVRVPFGLRTSIGLLPGTRTLVVTVPGEGSAAILSVDRVLASLAPSQ